MSIDGGCVYPHRELVIHTCGVSRIIHTCGPITNVYKYKIYICDTTVTEGVLFYRRDKEKVMKRREEKKMRENTRRNNKTDM